MKTKRIKFQAANPYTIQLDIDSSQDMKLFELHISWLNCIMNESGQALRAWGLERSRRNGHWHGEIKLSKPLPAMTRVAIAAIMGSDRAREMCNFERLIFKSKFPILFFKPLPLRKR